MGASGLSKSAKVQQGLWARYGRVHEAWTGLDWIGLDWTGLDWIGLDGTRWDWMGLDWTGFY